MRLQYIPLLIIIFLNVGVDIYIARGLRGLVKKAHIALSILLLAVVVAILFMPVRSSGVSVVLATMWMLFAYLTVYASKYVFIIFSLLSRLPRLWHGRRWWWLNVTGALLGWITFGVMWWGAIVNRFNIDVERVTVEIHGLPEQFDGYTIAQISDLHVGTYGNDTTYLHRVVEAVNSLHPDAIMFTGDIVNSRAAELIPHAATLGRLSAPDGVFSIMGNHDYGDYSDWPSAEAKTDNLASLHRMQKEMGWKLLLNTTDYLRRDSAVVAVIGVENIGDPPFHVYGDLEKAYATPGDSITKILLSHNPAHWVMSIADDPDKNIALTLSGHTHAMQVEVAGWSPAVFRYRTWGGLYESERTTNKLYVNIGIGTVGMPARIGATPEITLITLKRLP
ncbi:MAG: metallophosphoesterase [Barnesiella sp.]|nr:metallophosphoesterase [Barnesiella sp.]